MAGALDNILANMVNAFPFLVEKKHDYRIREIVKIFTNRDFQVSKIDHNAYAICYENIFGYHKAGYAPILRYIPRCRHWVVEIEGISIVVQHNPCFELINELRGYTILDNVNANDIVIDAGSSDGFISCYFAKKVGPSGRVICVEPDGRACRLLEANVKLNDICNLALVGKALYKECGRMFIELRAMGASKLPAARTDSTIEIETIDLETLISECNLDAERIKLLKLDIEGAELEVVDDLIEFVAENAEATACIASYHERDGIPSYREIEAKCKAVRGIDARTIYPYHATTFIVNSQNKAVDVLMKLPSYEEMKDTIWGQDRKQHMGSAR